MNREINVKLWYKLGDYHEIKYMILLVLSALHNDKKITDAKLKGQFKALREGTLYKEKGTHHCTITDRWYNNEPSSEVFKDVIEFKSVDKIPFDVFIKYIALFENKNYNCALNIFGIKYLYQLFNKWNPEYNDENFSRYIDFEIAGVNAYVNSYQCYECGSTHSTVDKQHTRNLKYMNEWLHSQKKGNLKMIPMCDISIDKSGYNW